MHRLKLNIASAALIIALAALITVQPSVMAYFSNQSTDNISINATPADQIWSVSSAFDENSWANGGSSGIYVTNKTDQDIWVYSEYTGDLKQVFKYADPMAVPAGSTVELPLLPLDAADSPRMLNPEDLIDSNTVASSEEGIADTLNLSWHYFSGTVKLHLLNDYDCVESGAISISGRTLWCVYFANKYGLDANTYYMEEWQNIALQESGSTAAAAAFAPNLGKANGGVAEISADSGNPGILDLAAIASASSEVKAAAAADVQQQNRSLIADLVQHKPLEFVMPVLQAVEQIAPGLLQERTYYQSGIQTLIDQSEALSGLLDIYMGMNADLEAQNAEQALQIEELNIQLNARDQRILELQQQISAQSVTASTTASPTVETVATTPAAPETTASAPAETSSIDDTSASSVIEDATETAETGDNSAPADTSSTVDTGTGDTGTGDASTGTADSSSSSDTGSSDTSSGDTSSSTEGSSESPSENV